MREKLIELLISGDKTVQCEHSPEVNCDGTKCAFCERVEIADRLIANGVTFATDTNVGSKWISVEDRLPGTQKVLITDGDIVMRGYRRPDGVWKYGAEEHMKWERLSIRPVTHWMPLPEPPKAQEETHGTECV